MTHLAETGRRLWRLWEKVFALAARIEDPCGPQCLFRIALRRYRGPRLPLPDGTILASGDLVGELHIKNEYIRALTEGGTAGRWAALSLREARASLRRLACLMRDDDRFAQVRALVGYTMLHRGTGRLGFAAFDLSRGVRTAVALYERWLIAVYHPDGWRHVRRYRHKLVPKLVVLGREKLMEYLGSTGEGNAHADAAGKS